MSELKHVRSGLAVKDLAASVAFYRDKLGFSIDFEVDGWCFLSRDQFRLMLGGCPDEVPANQLNDYSYFAYVGVEAIDELNREFRARGVAPLEEPESMPWRMREFMVTTPLGFFPAFLDLPALSYVDIGMVVVIAIAAVGGVKLIYAYAADRAGLLFSNRTGEAMNVIAACVMVMAGIFVIARTSCTAV